MTGSVAVVGAGPVGLMVAGELGLAGVDVRVYERLPVPAGESRALGFTNRVAELFDQRGLFDRLGDVRRGRQGHFGGVPIDLARLAESHHGVLGLPQSRTEEMLAGWLADLGVPVLRGCAVVDLHATDDRVTLVVEGPDGRRTEDAVAYVVGCDGGDSTVRRLAGIDAPGRPSTRSMYMADITGVEVRPRPVGERIPGGNMVLAVGLGDGYQRILVHDATLPPHPDPAALRFADIAAAWERLTGESLDGARARWMYTCGNAAGLATDYRRGRVLLAGEAAHPMPPLAGWGLSVGLQDAVNLGWKLGATVAGWAPDGLLDSYHAERHPIGGQLMRNTQAATHLYLTGEEMEPVRAVLAELMSYPDVAAHFAGMVSGLGVRYDLGHAGHPAVGLRVPPGLEIECADGRRRRIGELLRTGRGLFVAVGAQDLPDPSPWADRVDVVAGRWTGAALPPHAGLASVLIRPDGHLAWAEPDGPPTAALTRWFGVPAAVGAGHAAG